MLKTAHKARYVLAEPGLLLKDAIVYVSQNGRISRVETWHGRSMSRGAEIIDWGPAIILPGLINSHAHLELTSLHARLTRFDSFADWILQLIRLRKLWTDEDFIASAREGARLSLASGTTLVADITSSGVGWQATRGQNLRRIVFEELIALDPGRADQVLQQMRHLFQAAASTTLQMHGISPHAPYSVSSELYRRAGEEARNSGMLLATHAAETRAEIEFLKKGTGEFKRFLEEIDALPAAWKPPEMAPIPYLDAAGVLGPSCLLIHCNYLDPEATDIIRNTGTSVVYCPRSHEFFGHEGHPIRQLLDAGINVALGTDSLASNSSLSMIDEMRFLYRRRNDLKSEEIFKMATINGAAALGFGGMLGRLKQGYWADMTVLDFPQKHKPRNMLDQILQGRGECIATVVQGRLSWRKTHEAATSVRKEEKKKGHDKI
jgi:cytosine/adenosine deaminase-related metal-dependent hydrolase